MLTSEEAKEQCTYSGGKVETVRDGYFYTNALCISLGIVIFFWVKKKATYLQSLPNTAWRGSK